MHEDERELLNVLGTSFTKNIAKQIEPSIIDENVLMSNELVDKFSLDNTLSDKIKLAQNNSWNVCLQFKNDDVDDSYEDLYLVGICVSFKRAVNDYTFVIKTEVKDAMMFMLKCNMSKTCIVKLSNGTNENLVDLESYEIHGLKIDQIDTTSNLTNVTVEFKRNRLE